MAKRKRGSTPFKRTVRSKRSTTTRKRTVRFSPLSRSSRRGGWSSQSRSARRNLPGRMNSDNGSSGYSKRFRRSGIPRGFKKILAPQILNSAVSGVQIAPINAQKAFTLTSYTGENNVLSSYLISTQDTGDMNAILGANDPTAATTVAANNSYLTRRFMIKSVRAKYTLKNATNIPIEVVLYDVQPKRDMQNLTNNDPVTLWNFGMADQSVTLPGGAVDANSAQSAFPGSTPFQSQYFCQFWTVKRKSRFILHAGSEHVHWVNLAPKYPFNAELTRNMPLMRGVTTAVMAVIKGGVAQDGTNTLLAGTSIAELAYTCETQYSFTAMERSRTLFTQYNGLAGSASRTVLEDTDVITTTAAV